MPIAIESKLRRSLAVTSALVALTAMSACSKKDDSAETASPSAAAPADNTATASAAPAGAPAGAPAAPAADNTDTVSGVKFASYKGDATKGEQVFVQCKTCHVIDPGQNRIGPSLANVVGRHSGSIAGFAYSDANKNSGIVWTEEKLFQYLEAPQRVVPGTKMTFTGIQDPQQRADVIAYLKAHSS